MTNLGNLQRLDPRSVWDSEPADFTPWLAKHIEMLGDTLGLELELVQRESSVGDFSVDLLARDLGSNDFVVIENQLDDTDHRHLGQLLTYAAGTSAGSVVWLCRKFREEHRETVDWLNEHCRDVDFFGIVLELLQIDDSKPAVNFRPVAFPNDWKRESQKKTESSELTDRSKRYRNFFQQLIDRLREKHNFTGARKGQPQNWYSFASGHHGFEYNVSFGRGNSMRTGLYIDTGDGEDNLKSFDALQEEREPIETQFGDSLKWERLPDSRACRIANYRDGSIEDSNKQVEEYLDWAEAQLLKAKDVFDDYLRSLHSTRSQQE